MIGTRSVMRFLSAAGARGLTVHGKEKGAVSRALSREMRLDPLAAAWLDVASRAGLVVEDTGRLRAHHAVAAGRRDRDLDVLHAGVDRLELRERRPDVAGRGVVRV